MNRIVNLLSRYGVESILYILPGQPTENFDVPNSENQSL